MKLPALLLAALLATPLLPAAHAADAHGHGAHQHGVAQLDVAVEDDGLTLQLDTPLDNLLGFERAPRSAAERRAADAALQRLRQPQTLFRLPAEAGCQAEPAQIDAGLLDPAHAAHGKAGDGHADLSVLWRWRCSQPKALTPLRVDLFDAFGRLRRLEVQLVGPQGQAHRRLTPDARTLRWP